jgi:hypothetical protein
MPKDFRRLTNPRDAVEHNNDTLPWVIVAEHGSKAASSSDFPWQAIHEPRTDGFEASGHNRLSLPSSKRAAPTSGHNPRLTPADEDPHQRPQTTAGGERSLRVIIAELRPYTAAPTSRCKTRLHVSTGRREAKASTRRLQSHDEVQIRRLQQGSDNNAAAVARP